MEQKIKALEQETIHLTRRVMALEGVDKQTKQELQNVQVSLAKGNSDRVALGRVLGSLEDRIKMVEGVQILEAEKIDQITRVSTPFPVVKKSFWDRVFGG